MFACEHFLLFAAVFIMWFINKKPKWVRNAIAKEKYEIDLEAKRAILLSAGKTKLLRKSKKLQ